MNDSELLAKKEGIRFAIEDGRLQRINERNARLLAENARLREAMRQILEIYHGGLDSYNAVREMGRVAEAALNEGEDE